MTAVLISSLLLGPWAIFDFYFLVMSIALIFSKPQSSKGTASFPITDEDQKFLTILIPTYNNSNTVINFLVPRLNEFKNVDGSLPVAVTIVDSSTDGTQDKIIEELGLVWQESIGDVRIARNSNITLLYLTHRQGGKGWAINKAASMLSTEYFAIVDSDWVLSFEELAQAAVYLRQHPEKSYAQLAWRAADRDLNLVEGIDQVSIEYRHQFENRVRIWRDIPITIHGSAVVIRTQDFMNLGGFDDGVLSEDVDLAIRLMLQNRFGQGLSDLSMRENPCDHWRQFFWQKARWAEGRSQLLRRYAGDILRSIHFNLKQKIFWIYYLAYFGRCVGFAVALALSLIGLATHTTWAVQTGCLTIGAAIILRLIIHGVTATHKTNQTPWYCRLIEPFTFYGIGLIYTYTFFKGLVIKKGVWHVIECKNNS